jgi:hypothetical protein
LYYHSQRTPPPPVSQQQLPDLLSLLQQLLRVLGRIRLPAARLGRLLLLLLLDWEHGRLQGSMTRQQHSRAQDNHTHRQQKQRAIKWLMKCHALLPANQP